MSTQQVVDTILSQAKAEADRIRPRPQARIDADQAAHEAELNRYREQTQQLAQAAAEDRKSRMLAAARMDIRKETLAAKVKWLDEVFARAKRRILSLPDEEYQELMTTLMVRAIRTGDEEFGSAAAKPGSTRILSTGQSPARAGIPRQCAVGSPAGGHRGRICADSR